MTPKPSWTGKVALITGGSAGLGLRIAEALGRRGGRVAVCGRDPARLQAAAEQLQRVAPAVRAIQADVTLQRDVQRVVSDVLESFGQVDVLVAAAGRSSRGTALQTPPDEFGQLWQLNFLGVVHTVQAAAQPLIERRGHVVLIGSLASKIAARYLGAYPSSKFALAAYAQQLRLELSPQRLHVLLVCPGPIARPDAGHRYDQEVEQLPAQARQPGAGVRLKGIDPAWLAERIVWACERRRAELVVPARARWLFALAQIAPTWADRIIRMKTGDDRTT